MGLFGAPWQHKAVQLGIEGKNNTRRLARGLLRVEVVVDAVLSDVGSPPQRELGWAVSFRIESVRFKNSAL